MTVTNVTLDKHIEDFRQDAKNIEPRDLKMTIEILRSSSEWENRHVDQNPRIHWHIDYRFRFWYSVRCIYWDDSIFQCKCSLIEQIEVHDNQGKEYIFPFVTLFIFISLYLCISLFHPRTIRLQTKILLQRELYNWQQQRFSQTLFTVCTVRRTTTESKQKLI